MEQTRRERVQAALEDSQPQETERKPLDIVIIKLPPPPPLTPEHRAGLIRMIMQAQVTEENRDLVKTMRGEERCPNCGRFH